MRLGIMVQSGKRVPSVFNVYLLPRPVKIKFPEWEKQPAAHIRQALLIQKMNETADGPQGDQGPKSGHGGLEKYIFPMFTEPGGHEGPGEQGKQPGGNHVIGNVPSKQRHGLFPTAFFKLLAAAARAGIVAAHFGALTHYRLLGFLMNLLVNGRLLFAVSPPAVFFQEF
jgi:hypothetical protein